MGHDPDDEAFTCAARLRRVAGSQPARLELRRIDLDTFIVFMPQPRETGSLVDLARDMLGGMSHPVMLGTSEDLAAPDAHRVVLPEPHRPVRRARPAQRRSARDLRRRR